jgi:hypothetical protein
MAALVLGQAHPPATATTRAVAATTAVAVVAAATIRVLLHITVALRLRRDMPSPHHDMQGRQPDMRIPQRDHQAAVAVAGEEHRISTCR